MSDTEVIGVIRDIENRGGFLVVLFPSRSFPEGKKKKKSVVHGTFYYFYKLNWF